MPRFRAMRAHLALEPDEALEVIGQVGHPDLDARTGDADGADEQPHAVLLASEHVLDRRTHGGALRIGPGDMLGQWPTWHAPLVDIALEHAALEERLVLLGAIGRVRPHPRASVLLADELDTRKKP